MNNRKFNSVNSKKIYKLIIIRTLVCVCVWLALCYYGIIEFYDNNNEAGRTLFCYFRKIEKDEWIRMKSIMFNVH